MEFSSWIYPAGGIIVAVFDTMGFVPWTTKLQPTGYGQYDNILGNSQMQYCFEYYTNSKNTTKGYRNSLVKFIDTIPKGLYVLAYSSTNPNIPLDTNLYRAFESLGSANIRDVKNNCSYILFSKKAAPIGYAKEYINCNLNEKNKAEETIVTSWKEGRVSTEIVGPAVRWSSLHWRTYSLEKKTKDYARLFVIGIKKDGEIDTLIKNLAPTSADIWDLQNYADAKTYPYLKLVAQLKDDSLFTPPQIKRWQVIYDGIPETAIDPSANYSFYKDTLQEGDTLRLTIATRNISPYNMDSLKVAAWIIDQNKNIHKIQYKKLRPHPAGDILIDTIKYSTKGLPGNNIIWVEMNPDNDQLEQYHFNNFLQVPFFVNLDITNPILDVTFDGVHILNNDIVSSKPTIEIQLKDENKYLPINDTSYFRLLLRKPNEDNAKRIYFGNNNEVIKFFPASLPKNSCRIEYHPTLSEDGTYDFIVQAKDASNNNSGAYDYKISFNVINKSSITEILNWPNPFSSSTRFVFILTGSEIPTTFKIQIMTITGKVVREINKEEIGNIHIGRNISEYAWDGKDQYGNQLANGVYLYKVIAKYNNDNIEKYNNGINISKYFKGGLGKMYLMR
jgi:hypothetical protein